MAAKGILKLYIAGETARSRAAMEGLRLLLADGGLAEAYELAVIDVLREPGLAEADKVLAVPTVIKESPGSTRRLIGDLSDQERVMVALDLVSP